MQILTRIRDVIETVKEAWDRREEHAEQFRDGVSELPGRYRQAEPTQRHLLLFVIGFIVVAQLAMLFT